MTPLKHKLNHVTLLLKYSHWLPLSLLPRPSELYFLWPLTTSLTCSPLLSSCSNPFGFLVIPWTDYQSHSFLRTAAFPGPSTWNLLPLIASTAPLPSWNLCSNLAFCMKLPLTTLSIPRLPCSTKTLQHIQSSCSNFSFFHSTSLSDIISLFTMCVNSYLSPPLEGKLLKDWHFYMFFDWCTQKSA